MKTTNRKILSLVLSVVMLLTFGFSATAAMDDLANQPLQAAPMFPETVETPETQVATSGTTGEIVPEDFNDLFVESLSKSISAGTYMDDNGEIVLAVTDVAKTNRNYLTAQTRGIRSKTRSANGSVETIMPEDSEPLEIVKVQYSLAQLENAKDDLVSKWDDLNIDAVGFDTSINGLAVYTNDLSEENKRLITDNSLIKNLVFYSSELVSNYAELYDNSVEDDVVIEGSDRATRAVSTIHSGMYLYGQYIGKWSSVGWRARVNGQAGYITCGHGYDPNERIYYSTSSSDLVGSISKRKINKKVDYSFVPSNAAFGGMRGDGRKIDSAGSPTMGATVIFDGAKHYDGNGGRVTAVIQSTNTTSKQPINNYYMENLIIFDHQPLLGDSGCAIIQKENSKYKLIGFNVSQFYQTPNSGVYPWGAAIQYTNVRDDIGAANFQIMN